MYDDFAQYDGIMGASLSPALVEGGGRQSRVLPNLSVDLDYMEPTIIDSCIYNLHRPLKLIYRIKKIKSKLDN